MKRILGIALILVFVSCTNSNEEKGHNANSQDVKQWDWDYTKMDASVETALAENEEGYSYILECYKNIDSIIQHCDTLTEENKKALFNAIALLHKNQSILFLRQMQRRIFYNDIVDSAIVKFNLNETNPEEMDILHQHLLECSSIETKGYGLLMQELLNEDFVVAKMFFSNDTTSPFYHSQKDIVGQ